MKDEEIEFSCNLTNVPQLSQMDKELLDQDISLEELKQSLKQTKRNVSAGSDGLSYEFYIMFWNRLGPMLHAAATLCLEKQKLFDSALKGILVTIPKKDKNPKI